MMTLKDIKKLFKEKHGVLPTSYNRFQELKLNYKKLQADANKAGGHYRKEFKINHDFEVFKSALWDVKK